MESVVDGDLCELFVTLPEGIKQKVGHLKRKTCAHKTCFPHQSFSTCLSACVGQVASGLDRSVADVAQKLENVRNKLL